MKKSPRLRVLFNDAHANHPNSPTIPQGGPARFAQIFAKHFKNSFPSIELISVLFSHNTKDNSIYVKETTDEHLYLELIYPRDLLIKSYTKTFTKNSYRKFLNPWFVELDVLFNKALPDVVFLNGFNLSNWLLLETAYKRGVPVCVQHAGIWKKEIQNSKSAFSSSIRRIFVDFEKEISEKADHQIFLNEFSRDVFFEIHNIQKNKKNLNKTSIIPLPITIDNVKIMNLLQKPVYQVGVVARWDSIKNHSAVARLASYKKLKKLPLQINVVTEWKKNTISNFKNKYETLVQIVASMNPSKLTEYYSKQDIILIPSLFDVSPTVLMEALVNGKPAIISNSVGWVSDYKKFGLNDLVISPHASGKLITEVVYKLIDRKSTYLSKFKKLQKEIVHKHNPTVIFSQYNKIFNLISKKQ